MKMDFSKFKKISSDDKSTTLKHPEGHKIVVAHHALSPEMRKQIKAIPAKYADGGEVDEQAASDKKLGISKKERAGLDAVKAQEGPLPSDSKPAGSWSEGMWDKAVQMGKSAYNTVNDALSSQEEIDRDAMKARRLAEIPQIAPAPTMMAAPQGANLSALANPSPMPPQANPDPFGYQQMGQGMMAGLNQEKAGASLMAQAAGQEGKAQALAAEQQQKDLQIFQQEHQKKLQELQAERQALLKDFKDGHVNPNHYQESMSSGKKVQTAIGIMLGAIGSAFTGGENPGLAWLNKQIERDIEAQKSELGKKQNLLTANMQAFGNLHDAEVMTRINLNDMYSAKVAQAAAGAMGPKAQANAQMYIGQKNMESAQLQQQLGMRQAAMGAMNGAADPASKIRMGAMVGIIPKEETEHLYKELEEAQNMVKARDNVMSAMQAVNQKNTLGNRVMHPFNSESEIDAIWDPMVAGLSKDTAGRFTEQDAEMLNKFKPKLSDSDKVVQEKIRRVDALMQTKMHFPRLKAFGINPYEGQRFGQGGQKTIQLGPAVK